MKTTAPKTEPSPLTLLRNAVFGGSCETIIPSRIHLVIRSWLARGTHFVTSLTGAHALLTLMASLALTGISNAAILAYEPFNYPLGAINNGAVSTATGTPTATTGGGFSGTWFAGGAGTTIVGGLTYPGLQTDNSALQWSTSVPYQGENLAAAILPANTPTVYVSFLYNAPSYTANKTGFAVDNGAGQNKGYYMGMTAPGTFGVATVVNGSGTVLGTAAGTISFGTTYFIVVKFDKDSGGTEYKSGSIWINPAPGSSQPAASGTFTGTYTDMNKIADFLTALGGSAVITDEIRFGTTWADVTPASGATPPATPTGLRVASSGANSVTLIWNPGTGSPASYNVKRATTSGGTYATIGTSTAPTVTFTDSVTGGATYFYEVSAVNAGGESANSSFVSATPTLGVPSAPTGLSATPGNNQVVLSWTAPTVGSPTSYKVLRGTVPGAYTVTNSTASTSYIDPTAANGTSYFYVVRAVNAIGASANSSEVTATPAAARPIAAYEPFNYAALANGDATTASGFTGNWTIGGTVTLDSGMTYFNLPTANKAFRQAPVNRSQVSLLNPLSIGTVYVSFLFNQLGDNGGNFNGVYFPGNGASSLFCGFGVFGGFTATAGKFGLGSVPTTGGASGGSNFASKSGGVNYNQVHLAVLKIDFNTSGANDTLSLWIDPPAGTDAPGTPADMTYNSFDVGTISGMGLNFQGGGAADLADEFRIGSSYGQVVGSTTGATVPTTLELSVLRGNVLSWSALATNSYQPQSSPDNSNWTDLGGLLSGSAVSSAFDPMPGADFYQVLEIPPVIVEEVQNGDFETDNGTTSESSNWGPPLLGTQPPTRITTDFHSGTACESLYVTNATAMAQTSILEQNVANQGSAAIIPGNTYNFSFWAKKLPENGVHFQQYKAVWLDQVGNILGVLGGSSDWVHFNPGTSWTQFSVSPSVAPADATSVLVQFFVATGADVADFGGDLIDDVSLTTTSPTGTPAVIPSTVNPGAVFTAIIRTNGVTATEATGKVTFKTNNVVLSTGTVTFGSAESTSTIVPANYTLTAIYSGDVTYLPSTTTLVVGSGVNTTPTTLVPGVSGNRLTLSWPADHTGWKLQSQTNSLATGITGTWKDVTGSTATNTMTFTIDQANPTVFYRLIYP